MTLDASRRPNRPSVPIAMCGAAVTAAALVALATVVVACSPPRETGPPTPRPTTATLFALPRWS